MTDETKMADETKDEQVLVTIAESSTYNEVDLLFKRSELKTPRFVLEAALKRDNLSSEKRDVLRRLHSWGDFPILPYIRLPKGPRASTFEIIGLDTSGLDRHVYQNGDRLELTLEYDSSEVCG